MLFGIFTSDKKKEKVSLKLSETATHFDPLARRASRSTSQSSNGSQSTTSSQNTNASHYPQNFVPFTFIQPPASVSQEANLARQDVSLRSGVTQPSHEQPSTADRRMPANPDMPFAQQRLIRMPSEVMPQITRSGATLPQTHELREATIPCLAYKTPRASLASEDFGAPPTYERAVR